MNTEEGERILVAKPVASRPTISDFRSFYEVIGGGSPSSEPTITAIRPKTVRFKPVMTSPPAQGWNQRAVKRVHYPPITSQVCELDPLIVTCREKNLALIPDKKVMGSPLIVGVTCE
ncbi:hypothetical protein Hanom_Chr07g00663041 [Helianthus anomalus]